MELWSHVQREHLSHCTTHKPRLLNAQAHADPSRPTLTLWWYQDFAVDGTPANGVNIHCAQIAPEVMAGVTLKALISQKGPVPCQDRADNQRNTLEAKNFSSPHWAPHAYFLQHSLWPSLLCIGYQSFSSHSGSRTALAKSPATRTGTRCWFPPAPTLAYFLFQNLSAIAEELLRAGALHDQLHSALQSFPQRLAVPSCQELHWRRTYSLDDRRNPVHAAGEHSITVQYFHFHTFHHIIPLIEERHLKN